MDKININAFKKNSGKWYAGKENVIVPEGLDMFQDEFEAFIRYNCGVNWKSSFEFDIVVTHEDSCDKFYMGMWK